MDIKTILELAGFVILVFTGFWKLNNNIQKQFAAQLKAQVESYHVIDKQLDAISITVSPYAQDISSLKSQQSGNVVKITKLEGMFESQQNDIGRLERQIEALQNAQRKS